MLENRSPQWPAVSRTRSGGGLMRLCPESLMWKSCIRPFPVKSWINPVCVQYSAAKLLTRKRKHVSCMTQCWASLHRMLVKFSCRCWYCIPQKARSGVAVDLRSSDQGLRAVLVSWLKFKGWLSLYCLHLSSLEQHLFFNIFYTFVLLICTP